MDKNLKQTKEQVEALLKSNKLSKESSEYYKKISASLKDSGASLAEWKRTLKAINDDLDDVSSSLSYIQQSFKESVQDLSKQNTAVSIQKKALNALSNVARDLSAIRSGEADFTTKSLKSLQKKAEVELANLNTARLLEITQGKNTDALDNQINTSYELLANYQQIEDVNSKINKQFGFTSSLIKGIGATLKKAGFGDLTTTINDATKETSRLGQKAAQAGKKFNANIQFAKSLGSNIANSLTPLKLFEVVVGLIVKAFMGLDKGISKTAQSLGISYEQSRKLNKEFTSVAATSKNIFVTTENLNDSFNQLTDSFGVTAGISKEALNTNIELTKQAGYQVDTANKLYQFSLLTGKSTQEITENALGTVMAFNAQNKSAINEKKLLEGISKTSSAIQLSTGASATELINAAANAKKFGMELAQVDAIAGSLLDFEQSIENELQAELLLGKDINLEKARQFALNNNLEGVAEEIAKQTGSAAGFMDMNRIEAEALAKAVGMTRDELAKQLMDSEALAALGGEGNNAQEAYNKLLDSGISKEKIASMLGKSKLKDQLEANAIQERFQQSLLKAQEIFVNLATALSPVITALAAGIAYMSDMSVITEKVLGTLIVMKGVMMGINALRAIGATIIAASATATDYELGTRGKILALLGFENAAIAFKLEMMGGGNILSAIGAAIEETKLGAIIAQGFGIAKNIVKDTYLLGIKVAQAAAALIGVSATTLGIGTAVALAAAAGGIAYLYSMTKADDLMSEGGADGGYGDRVLLAGKDAFALNNADTIVAGTNLNQGSDNDSNNSVTTNVVENKTDMKATNNLLQLLLNQQTRQPQLSAVGLYEVQ